MLSLPRAEQCKRPRCRGRTSVDRPRANRLRTRTRLEVLARYREPRSGLADGELSLATLTVAVAPYFSASTKNTRVHHTRRDCSDGRWIYSARLRSGTGGLPLCAECQQLAKADRPVRGS